MVNSTMANECRISKVEFDEDSIRPAILSFENGRLRPGQEQNLVCRMYRNKNKKMCMAAATDTMVYRGQICRDELNNNFIAVVDRKTDTIELIAVDHVILSPLIEERKDFLNMTTIVTDSTTAELNKQFGSKRVKRQTEQRERMKMDIENVKEQLEQTVSAIKVDINDMVAPSVDENDNSYRPPINRDADKVEDVYNIDNIISLDILASVSEEIERILKEDGESFGTTTFVTQQIKKLRKSGDTQEVPYQLLLYIDCLIKFMHVQAKSISSKKYVACSYSKLVHMDILKKFTVASGNSRLRPPVMRDKCLCYILVLSMIACGYKLNLESFAQELKIGIKKLQEVSRILAFHVSKEVASLTLPLPAPVSSLKRGKKRK